MPRIRTLKPEFFRSPDTAKASFPVRVFFQALWCWADDFGIGETNINGLLGFAFCDDDQVWDEGLRTFRAISAQDVRRFCADSAQHYGIVFYTVRGRHFYAIPSWDKHQKTERRETRRKNPTPDDPDAIPDQRIYDCADFAPDMPRKTGAKSGEMCAGTGEQGNRGTGEVDMPRKRGTRLDPDWMPEQSTVDAIKAETTATRDELALQHRKFVDYWTDKTGRDATKLAWDGTWRNWMRNAHQRGEIGNKPNPAKGGTHKLRALAELAAEVREMETANGKALEA